jgi:hypothetical protein
MAQVLEDVPHQCEAPSTEYPAPQEENLRHRFLLLDFPLVSITHE